MSAYWDYQLSRPKPAPPADPEPRPRRRWLLAAAALLLLLILLGGYGAVRGRGDVAKVQQLRHELFAAKGLTSEQRKAISQELRQEVR